MTEQVTGDGWSRLLRDFRVSAWRWEAQGVYREPVEQEALRQFLAGDEPDLSYMDDWLTGVRALVDAGRTFSRVRVLTEPLTDYLRFELAATPRNVAAGEDIRVIAQGRARELELPDHDFWIFDDRRVAVMHFAEDGFHHAEVITDAPAVAKFREIRDRAWKDATPFSDYLTSR
ncbi:DUF6879 family protein [Umezawaea endophytica]|uniref:DUF6879 domain-containing protein n=1 Tax=Umezawaea endophytica TaxID=1654476 RepID=A0A9X2VIZ3_9PSEU|nr:DUF6879 family protein [Umezawaea endophytica]MCS7477501.1 hypothetical protein [Umezawaea endophytica]